MLQMQREALVYYQWALLPIVFLSIYCLGIPFKQHTVSLIMNSDSKQQLPFLIMKIMEQQHLLLVKQMQETIQLCWILG